jgi:hypothetical protein
MRFVPGQTITRRYHRGRWCTWAQAMRVISDDEHGLLLWQPAGSDFATLVDADGSTLHEVTPDEMRDPTLTIRPWQGDVLILMPPRASWPVWWFFTDGTFTGWYVNLEEPCTRHPDEVLTKDLVLDITVTPDRRWAWKDTDEFARRTGPARRPRLTAQPSRYSHPSGRHSKLSATSSRTLRPVVTRSSARYVARCPITITRRPSHRLGRSASAHATRPIACS